MEKKYDVALSYASENKDYVEKVAEYLKSKSIKCFLDKDHQIDLLGSNLAIKFQKIFRDESKFVALFISEHYARKSWTTLEFRSALENCIAGNEYLLPLRFDDTKLDGLNTDIGYLDLNNFSPDKLAETLYQKVMNQPDYITNNISQNIAQITNDLDDEIKITVRDSKGELIQNAGIMLILPNGTYERINSNNLGLSEFNARKDKIYTAYICHELYAACVIPNVVSGNSYSVVLEAGSSMISLGGWDNVSNLNGSMNPIHDNQNRLYVYLKNLSINNTCDHPYHFNINQWFTIEDFKGNSRKISFKSVIGNCFLIDFR